jgi:hypothetical protein
MLKREFLRIFFSLFLIITCFAGCSSTIVWMGDLSSRSNQKKYNQYYYYRENDEIKSEDSENINRTSEYYSYPRY